MYLYIFYFLFFYFTKIIIIRMYGQSWVKIRNLMTLIFWISTSLEIRNNFIRIIEIEFNRNGLTRYSNN